MHRLFVGLSLSEVVADALSQLQFGLDGARWRDEEAFHVTLAFLGDANRHDLEEAHSALSKVQAPAFDMTLAGCGSFGDGPRRRAVWASVEASAALSHAQSKIATALRRGGFSLEKRKFTPHVTLAYLSGTSELAVRQYCAEHALFRIGPFPVREFHLFDSHLGGGASHYEILASYSFSSSR